MEINVREIQSQFILHHYMHLCFMCGKYGASVRIHLAYFEVFPLQNVTIIYVISQSYSIAKRN